MPDGTWDRYARVFRFGCSHGNRFDSCIEGTAKDKNGSDAPKSRGKWPWIVPILEANAGDAVDPSSCIDYGEYKEGDQASQFEQRQPEFSLAKCFNSKKLEGEEGKLYMYGIGSVSKFPGVVNKWKTSTRENAVGRELGTILPYP